MRSLSSYLVIMFMLIFWIFRIVVAFTTSLAIDIGFKPMNMNMEIILLFVTLACIVLIAKNKIIGAIIYLIGQGAYFGVDLFNSITKIMEGSTGLLNYSNIFISFIGIIIPIFAMFNMLVDKTRKQFPSDKNTDWFYKNEQFDRKMDERADKNQYRNY